jgi:uncharacterized protein with GYD domain
MIKSSLTQLFADDRIIFITLLKTKRKPTKEGMVESSKLWKMAAKDGVKRLAQYWTLGRYDTVTITEAKDEKSAMKVLLRWADTSSTETLVAITRDEAIKLLEK